MSHPDKQSETARLEEAKPRAPGSLMIPSLALSNLVVAVPMLVVSLFLVDIGHSFGVPVGVAGQIQTALTAVTVIVALIMGVLSIRYDHKLLLVTGLFFISMSALGCYLAPSFPVMLLVYSLSGFGYAMVGSMSTAMIGEYLPVERRGNAMGWIIAGLASAYLVGAPVVGLLDDWRLSFSVFVLPAALLSLLLALKVLPSSPTRDQQSGVGTYIQGFREILGNRSALACLLGTMLRSASFQVAQVYSISFYKQRFLVPTSFASIILSQSVTKRKASYLTLRHAIVI